MTLEEEFEKTYNHLMDLFKLLERRLKKIPCGENHAWKKVSVDAGIETLKCRVCDVELVTDLEAELVTDLEAPKKTSSNFVEPPKRDPFPFVEPPKRDPLGYYYGLTDGGSIT